MRLPVLPVALVLGLAAGCARHHAEYATVGSAGETAPAGKSSPLYNALYSKPLTSLGAKYAQLTPAAQTTVLAEVGSAQIYDVVKEQRNSQTYFIVTFRDSAVFPPLYIASDGSVLRPDLSVLLAAPKIVAGSSSGTVSTNDLSPEALKVLHERAPGAEVASIYKEVWGDHSIYVVTFKDEAHHPKLHITAEGNIFYAAPKQ